MSLTPIFRVLLVCFLATAAFSSCKKDKKNNDPGGASDENITSVTSMVNTQEGAALTFKNSFEAGKDSLDAFIDMAKWVLQQPDVSKVFVTNSCVLRIVYKSGIEGFIVTSSTDDQGNPYTRGGNSDNEEGSKGGGITNMYKTTSDFILTNKKVLVFSPYFPPQFNYDQKLADGKVKLQATQVSGAAADLSVINTFKDYGLIVINTHGLPQGFMIQCKVPELATPHTPDGGTFTRDEIKAMFIEGNGLPLDKFLNNELSFTSVVYYKTATKTVGTHGDVLVRDKYIRNLPHMEKAVVFGNFCYSGFTFNGPNQNNISEAFKSIGAIAYFGYAFSDGSSAIVTNPWAHYMEDSLISNLIDGDSTGIAHLANNTILQSISGNNQISASAAEMEVSIDNANRGELVFKPVTQPQILDFAFRHFFDPRYKYGCGTFTDPRDGEVYELACAGDKRWFAENLRYNVPGSTTVNGSQVNLKEFGRLYTYRMATGDSVTCDPNQPGSIRGVCPEGWHVANHYDFLQLRNAIGASDLVELSTRLKSGSSLWAGDPHLNDPRRNSSGFNAYPTGWAYKDNNNPDFIYQSVESGRFWLSSVPSQTQDQVGYVSIYGDASFSNITWGAEIGFSDNVYQPCRCVED